MPERLPGMHIADMDLHKRNRNPQQRIPDRDAGVREGGGVDDDTRGAVVAGGVQTVDDVAFVVGLEVREGDVESGGAGGEGGDDVWEGGGAVFGGFAGAEEVEVGTVD